MRRKNLAMDWIDNKKAWDMVPQCWIINFLKMYEISNEVINLIDKTMKTWRVELTAGGKSLAEAKFQWGIFQVDAPSPLNSILRKYTAYTNLANRRENQSPNVNGRYQPVYQKRKGLETLILAVRIHSQDIRMEFGKLLHYWEWSEYWEKSWWLEETCCHSNFSERPSANDDMKNSQGLQWKSSTKTDVKNSQWASNDNNNFQHLKESGAHRRGWQILAVNCLRFWTKRLEFI